MLPVPELLVILGLVASTFSNINRVFEDGDYYDAPDEEREIYPTRSENLEVSRTAGMQFSALDLAEFKDEQRETYPTRSENQEVSRTAGMQFSSLDLAEVKDALRQIIPHYKEEATMATTLEAHTVSKDVHYDFFSRILKNIDAEKQRKSEPITEESREIFGSTKLYDVPYKLPHLMRYKNVPLYDYPNPGTDPYLDVNNEITVRRKPGYSGSHRHDFPQPSRVISKKKKPYRIWGAVVTKQAETLMQTKKRTYDFEKHLISDRNEDLIDKETEIPQKNIIVNSKVNSINLNDLISPLTENNEELKTDAINYMIRYNEDNVRTTEKIYMQRDTTIERSIPLTKPDEEENESTSDSRLEDYRGSIMRKSFEYGDKAYDQTIQSLIPNNNEVSTAEIMTKSLNLNDKHDDDDFTTITAPTTKSLNYGDEDDDKTFVQQTQVMDRETKPRSDNKHNDNNDDDTTTEIMTKLLNYNDEDSDKIIETFVQQMTPREEVAKQLSDNKHDDDEDSSTETMIKLPNYNDEDNNKAIKVQQMTPRRDDTNKKISGNKHDDDSFTGIMTKSLNYNDEDNRKTNKNFVLQMTPTRDEENKQISDSKHAGDDDYTTETMTKSPNFNDDDDSTTETMTKSPNFGDDDDDPTTESMTKSLENDDDDDSTIKIVTKPHNDNDDVDSMTETTTKSLNDDNDDDSTTEIMTKSLNNDDEDNGKTVKTFVQQMTSTEEANEPISDSKYDDDDDSTTETMIKSLKNDDHDDSTTKIVTKPHNDIDDIDSMPEITTKSLNDDDDDDSTTEIMTKSLNNDAEDNDKTIKTFVQQMTSMEEANEPISDSKYDDDDNDSTTKTMTKVIDYEDTTTEIMTKLINNDDIDNDETNKKFVSEEHQRIGEDEVTIDHYHDDDNRLTMTKLINYNDKDDNRNIKYFRVKYFRTTETSEKVTSSTTLPSTTLFILLDNFSYNDPHKLPTTATTITTRQPPTTETSKKVTPTTLLEDRSYNDLHDKLPTTNTTVTTTETSEKVAPSTLLIENLSYNDLHDKLPTTTTTVTTTETSEKVAPSTLLIENLSYNDLHDKLPTTTTTTARPPSTTATSKKITFSTLLENRSYNDRHGRVSTIKASEKVTANKYPLYKDRHDRVSTIKTSKKLTANKYRSYNDRHGRVSTIKTSKKVTANKYRSDNDRHGRVSIIETSKKVTPKTAYRRGNKNIVSKETGNSKIIVVPLNKPKKFSGTSDNIASTSYISILDTLFTETESVFDEKALDWATQQWQMDDTTNIDTDIMNVTATTNDVTATTSDVTAIISDATATTTDATATTNDVTETMTDVTETTTDATTTTNDVTETTKDVTATDTQYATTTAGDYGDKTAAVVAEITKGQLRELEDLGVDQIEDDVKELPKLEADGQKLLRPPPVPRTEEQEMDAIKEFILTPERRSMVKDLCKEEFKVLAKSIPKYQPIPVDIDISLLAKVIANFSKAYRGDDLEKHLNITFRKYGFPTVDVNALTSSTGLYSHLTGTIMGKCFVCGIDLEKMSLENDIPVNAHCGDAFGGDFIPLVPVDSRARGQIFKYRKYCRWKNIQKIELDDYDKRSVLGRWTGGCSVRWIDLSGMYTERSCRNRHRATQGVSFTSKRMAKLEMALQHTDNGCIMSPVSSLVPMSRAVSLYARVYACVCTGNWCNIGTPSAHYSPFVTFLAMLVLMLNKFIRAVQ